MNKKKLVMRRETVRLLASRSLQTAAGGISGRPYCNYYSQGPKVCDGTSNIVYGCPGETTDTDTSVMAC